MPDFNQAVIDEFRANDGKVGGYFEGAALVLLTTTGAKSGLARTVPLGAVTDADGQLYVIGSAGGSDRHPAWFHNIKVNPEVTVERGVETGVERYAARAEVLVAAERDLVFAAAAETDQGWADYQNGTTRVLPVVRLTRI